MSEHTTLSNAFGGLRIANPDEDAVESSPPHTAAQESHSSLQLTTTNSSTADFHSTLSHESADQFGGSIGFNPDSYILQKEGQSPVSSHDSRSPTTPSTDFTNPPLLSHRKSLPLNSQTQQQRQNQPTSAPNAQQRHTPSSQNVSALPASAIYQSPNASAASSSSYRYRDDYNTPSEGVTYDSTKTDSRSGVGVPGYPPARHGSRSYGAMSRHLSGNTGPLPPRRPSHRARGPSNGSITAQEAASAAYAGSAPVPASAEEWRERGAAVSTRQETDASGQVHTKTVKKGVKDFNFGRTLGEGSYSTVLAATDRQSGKEYAIKVLDKRHIIKEKKVKYVNIERDTLNRLTEHPGIVRLYYTFQDERSLYFVLDLATGGELLSTLKRMGSFDVECTRFYAAQILDSVAYMHARGIIHRDLKPENVLLDRDMHTKITDFGTAKILPDPKPNGANNDIAPGRPTDGAEQDRANSFVGTAEYVSPELLQRSNACKASDLWAFGCIIYQLLAGRPPFKAANEYLTFQKILNLEYTFPDGFPPLARDLVERLLVLDPANRLSVEHIQNHAFFEGTQWGKGQWRQKAPRLKAYIPPPADPIKLNGAGSAASAAAAALQQQQSSASQAQRSQLRDLRSVTDLAPPSQLDIEWSPVLNNNERILKLGNLILTVSHPTNSPLGKNGDPGTPQEKTKLRSFFGGNGNRRKERLVLITSNARLVIAAAGGNDKKAKMEIDCLAAGCLWKSFVDMKGLTALQLDTRDKQFVFEDPRATTSDPAGSKYRTQEWLDALDSAREFAMAQSAAESYTGDSILSPVASGHPSEELGGDAATPLAGPNTVERRHQLRQTLRRNTDESLGDDRGGRRRFSKRHSKGGLAAVF